jgi:hypothetical protein
VFVGHVDVTPTDIARRKSGIAQIMKKSVRNNVKSSFESK